MEIASESEKVTSNLILHQHSEAKETHSVPKFIPNETKYFKRLSHLFVALRVSLNAHIL